MLLTGETALALGRETTGVHRVLLGSTPAVEGLQAGLPGAGRVRIGPGGMERELGPGPAWIERALVFRTLPGVALGWTPGPDRSKAAAPETVRLAWTVPLPAGAPEVAPPADGAPVLELPRSGGGRLAVALLPAPRRWRVEVRSHRGERSLRVGAVVPAGPAGVLGLVAGDPSDPGAAATVFRRARSLDAEIRSRKPGSARAGGGGAVLRTPDDAVDRAVAWADARLEALAGPEREPGRVRAPGDFGYGCPGGPGWIWAGHGLLAMGRFRATRRLLEWGSERVDPDDPDAGRAEAALHAHLAARHLLWSGDAALPERTRAAVTRTLEALVATAPELPTRSRAAVAAAAALSETASARERPGAARNESRLRDAAGGLLRQMEVEPAGRPLPVVGAPGAGTAARDEGQPDPTLPDSRTLARILDVPAPEEPEPRPAAGRATDSGLEAWAAWSAGDPGRAMELWRRHLRRGLQHGAGVWPVEGAGGPEAAECFLDPGSLGSAAAPLLFGLLGARGYAAFGRLRLAPRVPPAWSRLRVRGIRLGDTRVDLRYRRDDGRHTFVLSPAAGRVPPNLVFEPLLPETEIRAVRIDGESAELDRFRRGRWSGIRLQLPLDSDREVIVDGERHV